MKVFLLAEKIKYARRNAGLSQQELGEILRLSDKTISAYESARAIPPLPTLAAIAKATKIDVNFFFESKNNKNRLTVDQNKLLLAELKKIRILLEKVVGTASSSIKK
jgi:transcriptional regulator with XRE-family HTH domain